MSGQYSMNTDPQTWPRPDDVDVIAAQEAWEQTDDFADALTEWMVDDELVRDYAIDRFAAHGDYDRAFARWLDGRAAA